MHGLHVVRIILFFSFTFGNKVYPCALVWWLTTVGEAPDDVTGMWLVEPEYDVDGKPMISVIHLDCMVWAAHLIGNVGCMYLPHRFHFTQTLSAFHSYYVNKYIGHHAFEIVF
jgi:hypothetical protein